MKMLKIEVENRSVKELKGSFVRIDDVEAHSGVLLRTSEYDAKEEKRKEIPLEVKVWDNYQTVFSGSLNELANKLRVDTKSTRGVVDILFNHINNFSFNVEEMVNWINRQHRTLQQSFTRLCVAWLKHLASLNENQYDARNEASVKLAKKIMKNVEDDNLPFI